MLQNTPADPPVKPRIVLDTYDEEVDVAYRRTDAALTVHFKRLIREEKAVMTGMVLSEILQGIKSQKEAGVVRDHLQKLPYLETTRTAPCTRSRTRLHDIRRAYWRLS
jgi:hypothetical protein